MSLFDSASLVVTPNGVKEGKLYSIKPTDGSGDLSVTRATTATRVNSAGLIELVPYNLVTYSEQFDNASWTKASCSITANATTAPNGTTTADLLISDNIGSFGRIQQTLSASGTVTFSLFVKQNTANLVTLYLTGSGIGAELGANLIYDFNFTTNTLVKNASSSSTATSTKVENFSNNWKRISVTVSSTTITDVRVYSNWNTINSFSTYVWGAQLVSGTSAKEYFPTTDRLNIPRLDYTNGGCPSILVEPQRTNLAPYSNTLSNAVWTKLFTTITSNYAISPDGTTNANKVVETTDNGLHRVGQGVISVTSGQIYTFSFYAKAGERNELELQRINTSGTVFNSISVTTADLTLGTLSIGSNVTSSSINGLGNGWYKISLSLTAIANGVGGLNIGMQKEGSVSYLGDGTSGVYIYGFQAELGSYATSYIPTVASSVTRNADVISKTGISSLIGQTEGTLFLDFESGENDSVDYSFSINDGTTTNRIRIYRSTSNTIATQVRVAAVTQALIQTTTITPNTRYKCAIAYKLNDIAFYVNGSLIGTDTSATIPTCSVLKNDDGGGTNGFYRPIKSAILWKERLSNSELASLTTI